MTSFQADVRVSDERLANAMPLVRAFVARWRADGRTKADWRAARPKLVAQQRRAGYTAAQSAYVVRLVEQEMGL